MAGNRENQNVGVGHLNARGKKRPRNSVSTGNTPKKGSEDQKDSHRSDTVLPVYGDPSGSSVADDGDMSAMMYLRSVRDEAAKIPSLLTAFRKVAPSGTLQTAKHEPFQGAEEDTSYEGSALYRDGIYMAVPLIGPIPPITKPPESTDSEIYAESSNSTEGITAETIASDCLLQRFDRSREFFGDRSLAGNRGISKHSKETADLQISSQMPYNLFYKMVQETNPMPMQLMSCPLEAIYHTLDLATGMIKLNKSTESNLSVWIWALLSRLPDVGEMTNDDVSVIRNLGKRALKAGEAFIKRSRNNVSMTTLQDSDDTEDEDRHRRNTSSPPPGPPHGSELRLETFFLTIDTIILIVGARFGQKDIQMAWTQAKAL